MKKRYSKSNKKLYLLIVLLVVTVGYALLSTTLKIDGLVNLIANKWDVHWDIDSVNVTNGSVSSPAVTLSDNNQTVNFSAHLKLPGDFYEFSIDAVNAGTLDAMIDSIQTTMVDGNNQPVTLPNCIHFSVTYDDGDDVANFHKIAKREDENTPTRETFLIRIEYDPDTEVLVDNAIQVNISYKLNYAQADSRAIDRNYVVYDGVAFNNVMLNLAYNANRSSVEPIDTTDDFYIEGGQGGLVSEYILHVSRATTEQYNAVKDVLSSDELIDLSKNAEQKEMYIMATNIAREKLYNNAHMNVKMWYDKQNRTIYYYSPDEKIVLPKDVSGMFWGLDKTTSIDISGFDSSKVTNMDSMFRWCGALPSLDVTTLTTGKVTNMEYMFYGNNNLTTLDVGNWDTKNVTSMKGMFRDSGLTSIQNIKDWNVSKVINMYEMFAGTGLTSLDISGWCPSSVTDMSEMFAGNDKITSIAFGSNFDTSNATNMLRMFAYCEKLTNLDVSGFNTGKVTLLSAMFEGCSSLTNLEVSNWNTSKVEGLSSMFEECSSLTSLDLSGWDTSNVDSTSSMFKDDTLLQTIYVGDGWTTQKVTKSGWDSDMFTGCTNLVGGNGTTYNSSYTGKTYARIDVAGTPGYFTRKTN